MKQYLFDISQVTWNMLLPVAFVLILLYITLYFAENILNRLGIFGKVRPGLRSMMKNLLLFYEPLVLIILAGGFILIYPLAHGLLLLILLVAAYEPIKNYINGRIIQFDNSIAVGQKLSTTELKGIIYRIGRTGLQIKTNKGLSFLNYSRMAAEGYMLLSGEEIGGFYHVKISPIDPDTMKRPAQYIADLLATAPYLDWNIKPEISTEEGTPNLINAKIVVKDENHLYELITLIKEWGFTCSIVR